MRKAILILSFVMLSSYIVNAQTTVITDDSTYTPISGNALFEIYSQNNDKGILIPRLTTAQRTAISTSGTVDQSLLVYDVTTQTFWYFDGTAWVEIATGGTVTDNQNLTFSNDTLYIEDGNNVYLGDYFDNTDDQNIDSLTLNGLTLTTYIEDGNPSFVDLTAVSDSAISYIINNSDTLFSNDYFTDSLTSIIYNYGDTLFTNQTFIDSLNSAIYNYGDTLLYNSEFITALQDSIDTDIDNAYLTGTTLNIDENGNTISVDLTTLVNDADSDPTNEIELPATAINGQVLTWNGSGWLAQNAASGADNWGSQVVESDATLSGDGTTGNELTVVGDLTDDQNLSFTGTSLSIDNGNTVDLGTLVNDADADPTNEIELPATAINGQVLTWNGTDWVAQNAASGADNWGSQVVMSDATLSGNGTTGNELTVVGDLTDNQNISGSGLSGTTLTIGIENGTNETVDLSTLVGTDNQNLTFLGTTLSIEDGNSVNLGALVGTDDQNISGSGLSGTTLTIGIEGGSNESVDLSSLQDGTGTDDQNISGSGFNTSTNILTIGIENGSNQNVDLSSLAGGASGWELTGNAATTSNFIGTTNTNPLNFKINNTNAGKLETDNTFFGYNTGINISSGNNNVFNGDNAGYNITTGSENILIGHRAGYYMQSGNSNTAIGYNALYNYATSGPGPQAGGNGNVAIGKYAMFNPASGNYNTAVGYSAFSLPNSGQYNVFVGVSSDRHSNNNVSYAVAVGGASKADANYATAIGYKAYANVANSLILGQTTNNGNPNSATANTNVGINTITPDVNANLTLGEMDGTNEGGQISFAGAGSYSGWVTDLFQNTYRIFSQSSSVTSVQIFNNGTSVSDLAVDGTGYATNWIATSDSRIKMNQKDINYGLSTIMQISPKSYDKHYSTFSKNGLELSKESMHSIGFIAQELYKVVPEAVHKPKNENEELWGVSYNKIVPIVVKAIQEQQKIIDKQQKTIDKLIKQNQEILNQLKNK